MFASLECGVQLHWDAQRQHVAAHPATLTRLDSDWCDDDGLRLTETQGDELAGEAALLTLQCGNVIADKSVAPDTLVLPLASATLMGWPRGTRVRVQRTPGPPPVVRGARAAAAAAAAAALAGTPVPPVASRVQLQVWPPLTKLQRRDAPESDSHTADTPAASSSPTSSDLLTSLFHEQLLSSSRVLSVPQPPAACEFLVLRWRDMACLARVHSLHAGKDDASVPRAVMHEGTDVEVEVMSAAPVWTRLASSADADIHNSNSRAPFPHLRPHRITAAAPAARDCFPREWRTLNLFVHNAIQAHGAAAVSADSTASSRLTLGLAWGVPRALLLCGGAGCGKSALLEHFEEQLLPSRILLRRLSTTQLITESLAVERASDDVLQRHYAQLLADLNSQSSFEFSNASAPRTVGVLVLEDLDALLCGNSYPRLTTQLLALLERLSMPPSACQSSSLILLVGSVKNVDAVPSQFLSAGRFDAQLRMGLLTKPQRAHILLQCLARSMSGQEVRLDLKDMPAQRASQDESTQADATPAQQLCSALSNLTPGFIAADLAKLVQYALLQAARRWDVQQCAAQQGDRDGASYDLCWDDFAVAVAHTHPSAQGAASQSKMHFHAEDTPATTASGEQHSWPLVAGYPQLKKRLALTLHHWLHPASVSALGLRPISGVLFHGSSGVGKSLWASSLARHAHFNFLSLSVASLLSQWLGESEATLRAAFKQAAALAPCVLLLDQLESMAGKRDGAGDGADGGGAAGVDARILSTLLNELDGVGGRRAGVYVVACARRLSSLDAALLRPGRFDDVIEVPFPDAADRAAILALHARKVALAADVDLAAVAAEAEGLSGAELRELLSAAGMHALREDINAQAVTQQHLLRALRELMGTA